MARRGRTGVAPMPKRQAAVTGYQGASTTLNRGYVYWPQLDTAREIDQYTRTEICRRSRFLYGNVGFARRIVNGIARMAVGPGLRPVFKTKDKEWNILAAAHFEARAGAAMVFDLGGRYNFYQAQQALLRARLKDGDVFAVLGKTAANNFPAIRIYESHSVGNGSEMSFAAPSSGWYDGVQANNANRALAYRLLDTDGKKALDVQAQDIIPFIDYETPGQNRSLSIFRHAIPHMLDKTEIEGFLKQQVKASAQVAWTIKNATRRGGLGGGAKTLRGRYAGLAGESAGTRVEEAIKGGNGLELEPGAELDLVADTRPHPNTLGYLDYLARDVSWGTGFSPEILWDISKLSGGPTRFVLADAQEVCDEIQADLRERFCRRYTIYFLACEMNAKRLQRCQDPEWWVHDYVPPRKLTVDRGRDGKLYIQLQGRGMLSLERWYSEQGQDWKREMTQFIDEKIWIMQKLAGTGLSIDDIFGAGIPGNPLDPAATLPVKGKPIDPDADPDNDPGAEDPTNEEDEP